MTDKIDRLLEALEHPENYSEAQLTELLSDPETRELYNIMQHTGDALTDVPQPDIDREWAAFVGEHMRRRSLMRRLFPTRRAVTFASIMAVTLAVVATTAVVKYTTSIKPVTAETEELAPESRQAVTVVINDESEYESEPVIVVFKDETLESIISSICSFYGVNGTFSNPKVGELRLHFRWNQSDSLAEVVENLNNFQQFSISHQDSSLTVE